MNMNCSKWQNMKTLNPCSQDSVKLCANSLGMVYSNALQVRKLVRSLPKAWETKTAILEDGDLHKMT